MSAFEKITEIEAVINKVPLTRFMTSFNTIIADFPVDTKTQLSAFFQDKDLQPGVGNEEVVEVMKSYMSESAMESIRNMHGVIKKLIEEYSPEDADKLSLADFLYYIKN